MRGDCKWPAVSASVHFVLGGHLGFGSSRGLGRAGLSHPASSPTLYRSSIQLQSKMATSKNLVYREFRSKITPALQAMDCVVIQRVKWNRHGFFSCLTFRRLSKPLRAAESTFTQVSNGTFNLKICGYVVKKKYLHETSRRRCDLTGRKHGSSYKFLKKKHSHRLNKKNVSAFP